VQALLEAQSPDPGPAQALTKLPKRQATEHLGVSTK